MLDNIPPDLRDAVPGAVGSAIALRWIPGPWYWRLATFLGGVASAWFGTLPTAELFEMGPKWHGVLGLLLGLLSMSVVSKIVATIDALNPAEIARALMESLRKRLGVKND
jgi:hypothetical protein